MKKLSWIFRQLDWKNSLNTIVQSKFEKVRGQISKSDWSKSFRELSKLKLFFLYIFKFSGRIWRKMHCKFQVQNYSVLTQCKQQCSELFLNKLELESREVHNTKKVAGWTIYNFYIGLFPCSVMKYGDHWLSISRFEEANLKIVWTCLVLRQFRPG